MTKTPDQNAHTATTSPAGPIPRQAPIPTHKAGHTVNTGEQNTLGQQTGDQGQQTGDQGVGKITPSPAVEYSAAEPHSRTRDVDPLTVTKRFQREGRWKGQLELERNDMIWCARKTMSKPDAQQWVYAELDRLYPPTEHSLSEVRSKLERTPQLEIDTGQIQGLSDLPAGWPELPSNASLSSEVGWVQANRLRIVEEHAGGATVVCLGHALSPAPSWSALGWLETSIRSYAKFVDVAAKATASDDGEAGVMRRERIAIEEVRALLDEMMPDGQTCPECGHAIK